MIWVLVSDQLMTEWARFHFGELATFESTFESAGLEHWTLQVSDVSADKTYFLEAYT